MSGWRVHEGQAIALDLENVDTDQLIPARFMATPRAQGYGRYLLHDLRFETDGTAIAEFPLNRGADATVLLSQRNFGSGSSREAAVYALADFGIKVVVAPSFGDIFAANAVNNGLLPARLEEREVAGLIEALDGQMAIARIDLETLHIHICGQSHRFWLDEVWRQKLINGWDDIDLTGQHQHSIEQFRATRHELEPWAFPKAATP